MGYVPALDGLRALSLLAILLYHNGFLWARGGFLGVTVFFTLSGFLICSLLVGEHERNGTIRLRSFWGRRARRLVPAVLALLGVVIALVAAGVVARGSSLVADATATATWVANWRFIASGQSYANLYGDPSPFQHMWSLAVEEQFYLLLPLVLLACLRRRGGGAPRRLRTSLVLAGVAVASTVLCAVLAHGASTRAYFGTDTRVAEPLIGALLALALTRSGGVPQLRTWDRRAVGASALVALGALALLTWRLGEYDPRLYRGGFLLTAVLAAVVVAAATQPQTLVSRALSAAPLVTLGRISYGGYVYHWPIFIWLDSRRTGLDSWPLFGLRVLVTLAVAGASYALIEMPVRRGVLRPRLALAGWIPATAALVAAVAVIGPVPVASTADSDASGAVSAAAPPLPSAVGTTGPTPSSRPTARHAVTRTVTRQGAPSASATASASASSSAKASAPARQPSSTGVAVVPVQPKLRVAIVGDSLANNLADGLIAWEKTHQQIEVYNLAIKACPLVPGGTRRWPDGYTWDVKPECAWWQDPSSSRMQALAQFDPQIIVVEDGANELPDRKEPSWATYDGPGDGIYDNWMINGYQQAISTFTSVGNNPKVMLLNSVCADWNNLQHWEGQGHPEQRNASVNFDYQQLTASGRYSLHDLDSFLCPNNTFTDSVDGVSNGRPDGFHLSDAAALAVARDWLEPLLLAR